MLLITTQIAALTPKLGLVSFLAKLGIASVFICPTLVFGYRGFFLSCKKGSIFGSTVYLSDILSLAWTVGNSLNLFIVSCASMPNEYKTIDNICHCSISIWLSRSFSSRNHYTDAASACPRSTPTSWMCFRFEWL